MDVHAFSFLLSLLLGVALLPVRPASGAEEDDGADDAADAAELRAYLRDPEIAKQIDPRILNMINSGLPVPKEMLAEFRRRKKAKSSQSVAATTTTTATTSRSQQSATTATQYSGRSEGGEGGEGGEKSRNLPLCAFNLSADAVKTLRRRDVHLFRLHVTAVDDDGREAVVSVYVVRTELGEAIMTRAVSADVIFWINVWLGVAAEIEESDVSSNCSHLQEIRTVNSALALRKRGKHVARLCHLDDQKDAFYCCDVRNCSSLTVDDHHWSCLLTLTGVIVLLFVLCSPRIFTGFLYPDSLRVVRYAVHLVNPLSRSLMIRRVSNASETPQTSYADGDEALRTFNEKVKDIDSDKPVKMNFQRLEIIVDERFLVAEPEAAYDVSGWIWEALSSFVTSSPLWQCLSQSPCGSWSPKFLWMPLCVDSASCNRSVITWSRIGAGVLVVTAGVAFAAPLIFFRFSLVEDRLRLPVSSAYVTSAALLLLLRMCYADHVPRILRSALCDVKQLSVVRALQMPLAHFLLPLEKFGLFGFLVGAIYWPLVLPLVSFLALVYACPLFYLIFRLLLPRRPTCLRRFPRAAANVQARHLSDGVSSFASCLLLPQFRSSGDEDAEHVGRAASLALSCFVGAVAVLFLLSSHILLAVYLCTTALTIFACFVTVLHNPREYFVWLFAAFWLAFYALYYRQRMRMRYRIFVSRVYSTLRSKCESIFASSEAKLVRTAMPWLSDISATIEWVDGSLKWRLTSVAMFVDELGVVRMPRSLLKAMLKTQFGGWPSPPTISSLLVPVCGHVAFVLIVSLCMSQITTPSSIERLVLFLVGAAPILFSCTNAYPADFLVPVGLESKLDKYVSELTHIWPVYDLPFNTSADSETSSSEQTHVDLLITLRRCDDDAVDTSVIGRAGSTSILSQQLLTAPTDK